MRPKKRDRKLRESNPLAGEVERLRKESGRLAKKLRQAEFIIDVPKKVSQILGITLETPEKSEID